MKLEIEYGENFLSFNTPNLIALAGMGEVPEPVPMPESIKNALASPIQSESLGKIAENKKSQNPKSRAVIVVSDNTRPVPYYGKSGILFHIFHILFQAGFDKSQITILIGAGSHRNMTEDEIEDMIGLKAMGFNDILVVNHEYDRVEQLTSLGYTRQGSHVLISKIYYEADLKIVTGLVESHFMAGASGGRKGICPAIVGKETLTLFHGAKFLSSLNAADLILEGNPLHEEASEIATMAGCDFLVNVTIDSPKQPTGIFAGNKIREYVSVPIKKKYDIVLIPAGFVGINHYQAAKAAIEASRAVKRGGKIIIVAKNTDQDPIGGEGYKTALKLLKAHGSVKFMEMITDPDWQIVQEQWEVQMWCKVLDIITHPDHLYYCALEIPELEYAYLPGNAVIKSLTSSEKKLPENEMMTRMIEIALEEAISNSENTNPDILFLKDGPYGIPELS
jgi:nickel-dependent lactate racemase